MSKYIIEGGNKLKGKIAISGNKNSILPCMAACLLTDEEVILRNVPNISDVQTFIDLLKYLGAEVEEGDHLIKITCKEIKTPVLSEDLVTKIRASILLVGPLLARTGKAEFSHPGGDVIGKRSIEVHLEGLENLGFKFKAEDRHYKAYRSDQIKSSEIFLFEPSVTATENLILGAVLGHSTVTLKNCAKEPSVVDLCNLLIKMGAEIIGVGNSTLIIKEVKKLSGADFIIGSDFTEFGTYAIAAAITGGEIEIEKNEFCDLEPIIYPLMKMGLIFKDTGNAIVISAKSIIPLPTLKVNIWPGFPTDLMSAVIVLATQAKGVMLCHDWMYESRMFFVDKLISMGAQITIADPHRVLVYGPTKLIGRRMESPDIRAGMALVLAALIANDQSIIDRAELIERGYENMVEKLTSLGANIQKVD